MLQKIRDKKQMDRSMRAFTHLYREEDKKQEETRWKSRDGEFHPYRILQR